MCTLSVRIDGCTLCYLSVAMCPWLCSSVSVFLCVRVKMCMHMLQIEWRAYAEVCCSVTTNISYSWFNGCWLAASSNKAFLQEAHHMQKADPHMICCIIPGICFTKAFTHTQTGYSCIHSPHTPNICYCKLLHLWIVSHIVSVINVHQNAYICHHL